MNRIVRARLDWLIRDLDGAIAGAGHDREVTRILWRARAEIVRAKVVAEREVLCKKCKEVAADGDVRDLGGVT